MSTAEEGGPTANATPSLYGGGGAGWKFRKKPLRRQATPYDRPPTTLRGNHTNSNESSSWLTKLVVKPASKLISYGAHRFFASVFRSRLPPPPPLHPQESNARESDGDQGTSLNSQRGEQEPGSGQCSQPINSSSSNGVTELEHLLKQKTFTRSEIAHLAELLQSRAAEVSPRDAGRINVVSALDSGRQNEFASSISEGNGNDGVRYSAVMLTPIHNSKVFENSIASPAELAKAYMGSRPSQVSPSLLGMRNQLDKEGTGLLADTLIPSKSPIMSLAKRSSVSQSDTENGFITPRSRGRSAIYTMAHTPYSRVRPISMLKGSGVNSSGFAGPSTSLSSRSPVENNGNFDSRLGTLKRRSSALDDEIGSVDPMRRIRQKPNLLASRFHNTAHGVGVGSHAKQKPQMNGEERNKVLKNCGENDNESVPSTSYAHVPSKSKVVAAKILQQLEKITPKEKLPGSKLVAMQENSPLKLISTRLPGREPHSMEDVGSSKLLLNVQDDRKSGSQTKDTLPDVHESSPQKPGKAEGNDPNVSFIPSGRWNSVLDNHSAMLFVSGAYTSQMNVARVDPSHLLIQLEGILESDPLIDEVGFIHPTQFAFFSKDVHNSTSLSSVADGSLLEDETSKSEPAPYNSSDACFWHNEHKLGISSLFLVELYRAAKDAFMVSHRRCRMSSNSQCKKDEKLDETASVCSTTYLDIAEIEVMRHSKALLLLSCDFGTAWNSRKLIVSKKQLLPMFMDELLLSALVLSYSPKSERAWSHRRWVIKMIAGKCANLPEIVERESELVKKIVENSKMNYRAWNHCCWLVSYMSESQVLLELHSSRDWAALHVADNSCFHFRARLLVQLIENSRRNKDWDGLSDGQLYQIWKEELDWDAMLIRQYVGRESLWLHRRFLSLLWMKHLASDDQSNTFVKDEIMLFQSCTIIPDNEYGDYQAQATFSATYIIWLAKQMPMSFGAMLQESSQFEALKLLIDQDEKSFLWDSLNASCVAHNNRLETPSTSNFGVPLEFHIPNYGDV